MLNEESLIPEIQDWKNVNGEDFTMDDWITNEGTMSLAIGYSHVFWPDFVEHQGCIFFKNHFGLDNFNEWTRAGLRNFAEIERVINHIHILDLFTSENQKTITQVQVLYLGRLLKDIYHTKLKALFPEKTFEMYFNDNEIFEDLLDYQLTFHQKINETRKIRS